MIRTKCQLEYIKLKDKSNEQFHSIDTNEFCQVMLLRHGVRPTSSERYLRMFKAEDRALAKLIESNRRKAA